jgi:hypothetical protein
MYQGMTGSGPVFGSAENYFKNPMHPRTIVFLLVHSPNDEPNHIRLANSGLPTRGL